jgi:hypothetical protein
MTDCFILQNPEKKNVFQGPFRAGRPLPAVLAARATSVAQDRTALPQYLDSVRKGVIATGRISSLARLGRTTQEMAPSLSLLVCYVQQVCNVVYFVFIDTGCCSLR